MPDMGTTAPRRKGSWRQSGFDENSPATEQSFFEGIAKRLLSHGYD
jgi:hypothetical protein